MKLEAERTIHVFGLVAFAIGFPGTAQTLRAQAITSPATFMRREP